MTTPVHTLYRFFDAAGRLLYVGRTVDARSRWRDHERSKEWFVEVATVTREIHPDAATLDLAERTAIESEYPVYNIALTGRRAVRSSSPALFVSPIPPRVADTEYHGLRLTSLGMSVADCPPCDDSTIEDWCECLICHDRRMAELESIEGDYESDPVMRQRTQEMRSRYVAAWPIGMWLDDLFDLRMFRELELIEYSRVNPSPALASVDENGLLIGCPFCLGLHLHFLKSGDPMPRVLTSPCRGVGGSYRPVLEVLDYFEEQAAWFESESQRYAA